MSDAFLLGVDPGTPPKIAAPHAAFSTFYGGPQREDGSGAGFGPNGQVLVGINQPADSGSSQNDQGQVTEFVLPSEPRSDLILNAFQSTYLPVSDDALVAITAVVRSDACGFVSPPPIPNATFTIQVPTGLGYRREKDLSPGVILESHPPEDESGDVVFRYDAVVPASGVSATVEMSGAGGHYARVVSTAFTRNAGRECNYFNNRVILNIEVPRFVPGARDLQVGLSPSSPVGTAPTANLILNASGTVPGGRGLGPAVGFKVYTSTQPNVQTTPANLFASLAPDVGNVDVSGTPDGSFFVVTAVSDSGESGPSNEVGGVLPTVTKLKVSASKITGQGTGFAPGVRVYFGGLPFTTAPKLKKANTKVVQGGALITGQSVGSYSSQSLSSGAKVLVYFVNPNGNGVVAEYTVP